MRLIGKYYRDNSFDFEDEDKLVLADQNGQLYFLFEHKFSGNYGGTETLSYGKAELLPYPKENQWQLKLWAEATYKYSAGNSPKKGIKCTYSRPNTPTLLETLAIDFQRDQSIRLLTIDQPDFGGFMDMKGNFIMDHNTYIDWGIFEHYLNLALLRWDERRKKYA